MNFKLLVFIMEVLIMKKQFFSIMLLTAFVIQSPVRGSEFVSDVVDAVKQDVMSVTIVRDTVNAVQEDISSLGSGVKAVAKGAVGLMLPEMPVSEVVHEVVHNVVDMQAVTQEVLVKITEAVAQGALSNETAQNAVERIQAGISISDLAKLVKEIQDEVIVSVFSRKPSFMETLKYLQEKLNDAVKYSVTVGLGLASDAKQVVVENPKTATVVAAGVVGAGLTYAGLKYINTPERKKAAKIIAGTAAVAGVGAAIYFNRDFLLNAFKAYSTPVIESVTTQLSHARQIAGDYTVKGMDFMSNYASKGITYVAPHISYASQVAGDCTTAGVAKITDYTNQGVAFVKPYFTQENLVVAGALSAATFIGLWEVRNKLNKTEEQA